MKRGEKWFPEKTSELVWQRRGLPPEIALPGEASSHPLPYTNATYAFSIGENRTLLRTVALVLLFITVNRYGVLPLDGFLGLIMDL